MKTAHVRQILFATLCCIFSAGCEKTTETTELAIPKVLPSSLKVEQNNTIYIVTGLGLSNSNRMAIINNKIYTAGTQIAPDITLKDIQLTYACLLVGDKEYLLRPESIQRQMDLQEKQLHRAPK